MPSAGSASAARDGYAQYPDLRGKRVLVTGASKGIGKATALAFAASGAKVAVNGRWLSRLEPVVAEINALGSQGFAVVGDLSKEQDWEHIVKTAISSLGGLDVLVNNGPGYVRGMFEDAYDSPRAYELAVHINVAAAVGVLNAALPELLRNKGAVVNVSSILALFPRTDLGYSPYGVSKLALIGLTQTWALRYALQGLRVNGVIPGLVATTGMDKMMARTGMDGDDVGGFQAMGRMGQPEELASAIVFLASKSASFITGENLKVEGGGTISKVLSHPLPTHPEHGTAHPGQFEARGAQRRLLQDRSVPGEKTGTGGGGPHSKI